MTYNPYDHSIADASPLVRLDGKVALVTGAAQRIGREISRVFAAQGARVVVSDVNDARGEEAVAEIRATGGEATYQHADVGQSVEIRALVEKAVAHYGRLDILVNNAHWEKRGTVVELDEADWDRSMDVLFKAHYLGCKYAIPEMLKVGGGSIVNLSSVHAYRVSEAYVTYQAAKAAVVHFTRQVAYDFGRDGIRVNAICPGAIPFAEEVAPHLNDPVWLEERLMSCPSYRPGHPRDIAFAALFLCSDLATWINGQAITVDAGQFNGFPGAGSQSLRQFLKEHPERLSG